VLPKGFVKVRYYGFFPVPGLFGGPGNRTRLGALQRLLNLHPAEVQSTAQVSSPAPERSVAEAIVRCPDCGHPMEVRIVLPAQARYPP
jgi:hypothetical protein